MPPITRSQADQVRQRVSPMLGYLGRLRARLDAVGVLPSHPLYRKVQAAYDSVHALHVDLHYRSCERAGRIPED